MREKCASITGKPLEYIGRLRYTLEGLDIPSFYPQVTNYLIYHYSRLLQDPDYAMKNFGDKIVSIDNVRTFLERGSFKLMGGGNSVGLMQCEMRNVSAFPRYFLFKNGDTYDHKSIECIFNPDVLNEINQSYC